MFAAIESAQESVYLEMYIFQDDTPDFNFLELLKQKARSGVKVRIILDFFGSFSLSKMAVSGLRASGAELFFLSSFLHRTHRKILVLDESLAFLGGVNFYHGSMHYNDLMMSVKGRLVPAIIKSFAKVYAECGGKDPMLLGLLAQNKKIILNKTRTWLLEHFPANSIFSLKEIFKKHLAQAEKNIILITPYFLPQRWLIGVLHQAVLRGVKVDVLVAQSTDFFLIDRANYFFMSKVSKLGVNFYVQPKMNHAKVMIIDRKEGIVGSNNVDFFSFHLNYEVGVFLKDSSTVQKLLKIAEEWKRNAVLFDPKTQKMRWFDYILSPALGFFNLVL